FVFQILYTGIVIYAPALALYQVTGIDLWGAVIGTGIVCTFYCTLGGLKAVIWTDVFQAAIMIAGFLSVIIRGVVVQDGFGNIINDAYHGGRLHFWEFNPNPLQRHTFWTIVVGGTFTWLGIYAVNQSQVQRYLSCKSIFQAKLSLYLNLVGLWIILTCAVLCGLIMYSVFKDCDPLTAKCVAASDQLMPYLVLEILQNFPGMTGLFVACAYSGTLSTVSSSINALAAVTVEDLIKPHFALTELKLSWISMGMSFFYGFVCIAMAALASVLGGLLQAALTIFGMIGGPLLGLFSLGVLFPFVNAMGAFIGLICGFVLTLWIGIGSQIYKPLLIRTLPLTLSVAGCNASSLSTAMTSTELPVFKIENTERPVLADTLYSLSYLYLSTVGTLITIGVGIVASLLTGGLKQAVDKKLLLTKEDIFCNFSGGKLKQSDLGPDVLRQRFTTLDYVIFSTMLLLSAIIGVFYAFQGFPKSHKDFLMADHNLSFLPVAFSLATSFMSGLAVLGTPAEVYRFGSIFLLFAFSYAIMVVISAEVFLPVFYRLGLTSVYEILYTSIVIYSPSLALNKVAGFRLWDSVIATGLICVFYCSVGGLKAVVWAGVFQYILMIVGLGLVFARAVIIKGGFGPILHDAYQGGRLNIWDFNPNPLKRYTVWTVVIGGTFTWVAMYATKQNHNGMPNEMFLIFQTFIQFYYSALYLNLVGLWIALIFASLDGLSMYSIYKDCDPLTSGIVSAPDQLMPYFVLDILEDYPGLPGLFVAGTYSASLSSVSISINALATKILLSLISHCLKKISLSLAAFSVFELIGGPLLGIYSLGILFPFANSKGAFLGFICGFCVIIWIGISAQKYPSVPHRTVPLPLSVAGCQRSNDSTFVSMIVTSPSPAPSRSHLQEYWYSVSYLYFSTLGALITFIVGTIVSLLTGGLNKEVDHRLLFTKKDFMSAKKVAPEQEDKTEKKSISIKKASVNETHGIQ
ncbi:Sodium-coupled monocarboxylate transporter 1, partial [Ophiophagus hannah]